jgi:hypothetical protein
MTMRIVRTYALLLSLVLLMTGTALAQDPGNRDTVRVAKVATNAGLKVGVPVTIYNDEKLGGYSLGLRWDSDAVTFDSTSYIGTRINPILEPFDLQDLPNRTVLFGMFDQSGRRPLLPGNGLVFTMWFTVAPGAPDQFVSFDSTFVPPAGNFILSDTTGATIVPEYVKGEIKIGNPQPPPVIVLTKSSFAFTGLVGGTNPLSQVQQILNGGGRTLNWTSTKHVPWLFLTPASGTAPSNMSVAVNITGMGAGIYTDTVIVSAADATNSPQKFTVTLSLTVPPPTIKLNPGSFYFQAQQNGADPPSQTLAITNIGLGTLNWTATKDSAWLNLSSYSGTAPSNVTINASNAGRPAGLYIDSIQVSDPTATNNPQFAVVTLEVFSEFPVILPSPTSMTAIGSETQNPFPHTLLIQNNGGGVMNWQVSKKKSWLTFDHSSGTATQAEPGVVIVNFNGASLDFGPAYDTIVITSSNAINSPKRVPVVFWKQEAPTTLRVSENNIEFTEYECGSLAGVGADSFVVNEGAGQAMTWTLTHNESWLTVSPTSGVKNTTVILSVSAEGLAPGNYSDIVVISSDLTINPSVSVYVMFTVLETPAVKEIAITEDSLFYIYNYTQVRSVDQEVVIYNIPGGCVNWQATSNASWLIPTPASGTTTQTITIRSDAVGLSLGQHLGKVTFTAAGAANSPIELPVELWVYTPGDANGDGVANIVDVVYIIVYIFMDGPAPVPVLWTGDTNCTHTINVTDAVWMIDWIFNHGEAPCVW